MSEIKTKHGLKIDVGEGSEGIHAKAKEVAKTGYVCNGCGNTILEEDNLYIIGKKPREYCWTCYTHSEIKVADREYVCRGCGTILLASDFPNVFGIGPKIHTYCSRCYDNSCTVTI